MCLEIIGGSSSHYFRKIGVLIVKEAEVSTQNREVEYTKTTPKMNADECFVCGITNKWCYSKFYTKTLRRERREEGI